MKKFIESLIWKVGEAKFSSHAHPKKFDWKWREKGFNRIALVNYLVSKTGGLKSNYLEIGCDSNVLFDAVASLKKNWGRSYIWRNASHDIGRFFQREH